MFKNRKYIRWKKRKCVKKGECDKGEHFDNELNKCVNDNCKRTNEYYSQKIRNVLENQLVK